MLLNIQGGRGIKRSITHCAHIGSPAVPPEESKNALFSFESPFYAFTLCILYGFSPVISHLVECFQ
jgi:hypothetical protein